jgi:hypothetical protein
MTESRSEFPDGIADPGVGSALECRVEPSSGCQIGGPITIKGTFHNSGSTAVWLLSWNTFLEPEWQDCLSVTHDGSPVPYVGTVVLRIVPDRDSYIRIPAGESVSRQVDLGQKYAITEPGDYEVSFRLPVQAALEEGDLGPPADGRGLELILVESEKASFRIDGVASSPAGMKAEASKSLLPGELPKVPAEPLYSESLDAKQREILRRAHWTAYGNIYATLKDLEDIEHGNLDIYNLRMDTSLLTAEDPLHPDPLFFERKALVVKTLKDMATWMATESTDDKFYVYYERNDKDTECKDGVIGHTPKGQKDTIYLCPYFFDDDKMRVTFVSSVEWARAATLVHEISHAAGSTDDLRYSGLMCDYLADQYPDLAVKNAENYARLVMMRPGNGLPTTRSYGVRCFAGLNKTFLGWLQSQDHMLTLNGDDPDTPPKGKYVKVSWYEEGSKKYVKSTNSSRYIGDNGNKGKGDTWAAWNLYGFATAVGCTESSGGQVYIEGNPTQHLCVQGSDKRVFWKAPVDSSWASLWCEFCEATD